MSEEKNPAEPVEAAKPAEAPAAEAVAPVETPKAEAPKEKKPMDPKKKKNIIIWSCIGGGVLIAGIVAAVLIIVLSKVDYKESFELAYELDDKIGDFYYGFSDCVDVANDVNNEYKGTSTYSSKVEDCKKAVDKETIDKVNKLAGTSGVARDGDVKAKFDKFYDEYKKATSSINDDTAKTLDVYDKWHQFVYESDDYYFYSITTQSDIDEVANYAINSGNDTLKAFGEQWKTKATEALQARQAYDKATSNYSALNTEATNKRKALNTWRDENLPKPSEILPLNFEGDASTIRSAWNDFCLILSTKYGDAAQDKLDDVKNSGSYEDVIEDVMNSGSYEDILKELMK